METSFGMVTEVRLVQLQNAPSPMVVSLLPKVTDVNPEQLEKAQSPTMLKESGSTMDVIHVRFRQKNSGIFFTLLPKEMELRLLQSLNIA